MKKFKRIAYVFLIIIIVILAVILYNNESKGNEKNTKEKGFSEIEFIETKLVSLLNNMNNIETRNYTISVSEITKKSKEEDSQNSASDSQNSQSEGSSEETGSGGNSGSNSDTGGSNEQNGKKFDLQTSGVLTSSDEIDWNNIKSEIEILYSSIPTITLDLYQLNVNQDDILGFNKEFDNLTLVVKNQNKEETLKELSKLYEYIPKFMQNVTEDEIEKILVETKSNVFKAYAKLDSKNWNEISNDVKLAVETYSKLLTNTNIDYSKQYSISKGYVMLNELQNAVAVKDESVFLIKYKNLLEEMNNMI